MSRSTNAARQAMATATVSFGFLVAVWTGTDLIVWASLTSSLAPSPRLRARGVWTGAEMLIVGGQGYPQTPDVSAYTPARIAQLYVRP